MWESDALTGSSGGAETVVAGVGNLAALAKSLLVKTAGNDTEEAKPDDRNETKAEAADVPERKTVRIGMIGLDTSHCLAFTKLLNDPKAAADIAGFRVVAVYPKGSPDIESSTSRLRCLSWGNISKRRCSVLRRCGFLMDRKRYGPVQRGRFLDAARIRHARWRRLIPTFSGTESTVSKCCSP